MKTILYWLIGSLSFWSAVNAHAANILPSCITKQYPQKTIQAGVIDIDAPDIAENGANIPITIHALKNPTLNTQIKVLHLYNDFRTEPVASFSFPQASLPGFVKTRIRLAENSTLYAVALLENGEVISGTTQVKVTIGGCGGGANEVSRVANKIC